MWARRTTLARGPRARHLHEVMKCVPPGCPPPYCNLYAMGEHASLHLHAHERCMHGTFHFLFATIAPARGDRDDQLETMSTTVPYCRE